MTAGCGRAQRWGGPIEEIRPGDVVWFPPGEKHWHGAAPVVVWNQIPWLHLLSGVRANERHFFEPRHEFDEVEPVIEAVMAGLGVAVLPASLVRDEVAQRRLVAVPFENGRHLVPVAAIHRKRRKVPPALQQFLQQPEPDSSPVGTCPSPTGVGEGGEAG